MYQQSVTLKRESKGNLKDNMPAYNEADLPQRPHLRTWRETVDELMHDYPEEFTMGGEESLKQQLQEIDERLKVEENYLDRPPQSKFHGTDEELDEKIHTDYVDYRSNKRWLDED